MKVTISYNNYFFNFLPGNPRLKGTANITVKVLDEDDNCPVFERDNYNATLEENVPFGTFVVKVHATDRDTGRYAELDYGILDGNDKGKERKRCYLFSFNHLCTVVLYICIC